MVIGERNNYRLEAQGHIRISFIGSGWRSSFGVQEKNMQAGAHELVSRFSSVATL